MLEDAAYSRLMRAYYRTETPIPADTKLACRLVRATTKQEREAVVTVLSEFFTLTPDGWHNKRCDTEIAEFLEGDDEREQKAAHEAERMRRYRERRKYIFAALRERGIVPKWDTKMDELERIFNAPETRTGADLQREQVPNGYGGVTANQTPEPESTNQNPDLKPKDTQVVNPSTATAVCVALRSEGIDQVNPQHPDLLELIQSGAAIEEFIGAGRIAKSKGKGFGYALGVVRNSRADALARGSDQKLSKKAQGIARLQEIISD